MAALCHVLCAHINIQGAFSGCIVAFLFAEKLGRRKCMWLAMVFIVSLRLRFQTVQKQSADETYSRLLERFCNARRIAFRRLWWPDISRESVLELRPQLYPSTSPNSAKRPSAADWCLPSRYSLVSASLLPTFSTMACPS